MTNKELKELKVYEREKKRRQREKNGKLLSQPILLLQIHRPKQEALPRPSHHISVHKLLLRRSGKLFRPYHFPQPNVTMS